MATYNLKKSPEVGQIYTITIWGTLAENRTNFQIYNSGGNIALCLLSKQTDGIYSGVFNWKNTVGSNTADDTSIWVYPFPYSTSGESIITKIKLEEGNNPNPKWSE